MAIIAKIAVPATVVAVVAIGIVLYASFALSRLSGTAADLVDGGATRVQLALQAESAFNSAAISEKNVILSVADPALVNTNIALYAAATKAALDAVGALEAITTDGRQRDLIATFRAAVGNRRQASAHVFDLVLAGDGAGAFAYSAGVAAGYRKTASAAVARLIALDAAGMHAARDELVAAARGTRALLLAGAAAGLTCAFSVLAWIALFQISRPLARMGQEMTRLAGGDLDIRIAGMDRSDEVGGLARALGVFRENAARARRLEADQVLEQSRKAERQETVEGHIAMFDRQVSTTLRTLADGSAELHATAGSMTATAGNASRQAEAAARACGLASANVQTVAAATEQLHASISEISRQVSHSAQVAGTAVTEAERTGATIHGLAGTARRVGEVVAMIRGIASQTNLLALNATIEAARAGDAGRGFAVVAGEVKLLAGQTAKATADIAAQIAAIQDETRQAVDAIAVIGGTIGQMSGIAAAIAAAVEQQGAATRDISDNIQQAARGTTEVSANVAGVNQAAGETGSAATGVLAAADALGQQTVRLRSDVQGFLDRIRAT